MKSCMIATGIMFCQFATAQNEVDALRYSQLTFGGTARYNAMGGAFGALGGDFSTLSSNPAGIGLYSMNEISVSPAVFNQMTSSTYNNEKNSGSKMNFDFGNAGFIWSFDKDGNSDESKWKNWNIGFGYNRTNDFNNNINIQGKNYSSSLSNVYVNNSNGISSNDLDQFNEGLAYNTYLIDNPGGGVQYASSIAPGGVVQRKSIQSAGGMGEGVISLGGNYADKLYLGATVGMPHINYSEDAAYSETALTNSSNKVNFFQMNQHLRTSGNGINFKMGAIYRINDMVRIGAAFHSPTSFSMHDEYSSNMTTSFSDSSHQAFSPNGSYDYNLFTSPKIIGSLAFVIAKKGLLGVDYEYIDYSYSRLSSADAGTFFDANNQIKQRYKNTGNLRVGAEWKIIESFLIRVGYAYYGNPYKTTSAAPDNGFYGSQTSNTGNNNVDASRSSYSAGIGFREKNCFLDFAYVMTSYKENYYLYSPANVIINPVNNTYNASKIMATFGVRF
ncbi:MAG: OmpP1/FadL family transporter [Bacteroidia bacterium]